jgi:lipoprotein-releasing system ATP-binding protein
MNNQNVLACENLSKTFVDGEKKIVVLSDINLSIQKNETIAIIGTSGSGKSTLLHLLGGLDTSSAGKVYWGEESIQKFSEKVKAIKRNRLLGFVYQFHHLLPEFTALENVAMPLLMRSTNPKEAEAKAEALLKKVGLAMRLTHRIPQLSGGEKQRVAIARALVTQPNCVLTDEPTGNLDQKTAESVMDVMLELQETMETSFIIVTHDATISKKLGKQYLLSDGQLTQV